MDLVSLALANIGRRKFRNGFTVISIAIGIAAIISLLALGEGMKASLNADLGDLAADITISPKTKGVQQERRGPPGNGGGGGGMNAGIYPMDESVLSDLRRVSGIELVVPRFSTQGKLEVASDTFSVSIMGVDPQAEKDYGQLPDFVEGKMFSSRDRDAVVIGDRIVESYFKYRKPHSRSTIVIDGKKYQIAGILAPGGDTGPGTGGYDNAILMSIDDAREHGELDVKEQLSQVIVRATSADIAEDVAADIEKKVDLVQTSSFSSMLSTMEDVMDTFSAFLAGIGSISLFVAAITILNNMYTAVMERRREIGTMKSLGMDSSQVLVSFSIEAAVLGLLGGVLGVALGLTIGQVVASLGFQFGPGGGSALVPVYAPEYMVGAVAFGISVALMSGLYPAWEASKMSPIEALRFE